jgi:ribosomal protein S6
MPCYQLIMLAKPETTPDKLAALFRQVARVVYREQGQFRYIENFGVRPLAYPVRKGGAKYEEARWVQALYDCAPPVLPSVGAMVAADKDVLQYKHLRYDDYTGQFKAKMRREKLKKFSAAMRWNTEVFDPESLTLKAAVAEPEMK